MRLNEELLESLLLDVLLPLLELSLLDVLLPLFELSLLLDVLLPLFELPLPLPLPGGGKEEEFEGNVLDTMGPDPKPVSMEL